jgi:hypothetical protein
MLRCCAYLFQSGTITMERLIALYQHFRACLDTSYLCTVVCGGGGVAFYVVTLQGFERQPSPVLFCHRSCFGLAPNCLCAPSYCPIYNICH